MFRFFNYEDYATVDTFEDLPQFLLYRDYNNDNGGTLIPLTAENKDDSNLNGNETSFLKSIVQFLRALTAVLKQKLNEIFKK